MSTSPIVVTIRGPLFVDGAFRNVATSEARSTFEQWGGLIRTTANRTVHRDLGVYERSWRPMTHRSGSGRQLLTSKLENVAPHAAVEEHGRRAGSYSPIDPLTAWVERKGIAVGTEARRVAFAISRRHFLYGWPNLGSYVGGQYLGPPRPVATALDRERLTMAAGARQLGQRVARRLS